MQEISKVAVVGLGYVGLPLALQFARAKATVIGLDVDRAKVELLNQGKSYIKHISDDKVNEAVKNKRLSASTDFAQVKEAEAGIIFVFTTPSQKHEARLSLAV